MATFTHHAGYQKFKQWSIYSTRYNVMQLVVSPIMNEEATDLKVSRAVSLQKLQCIGTFVATRHSCCPHLAEEPWQGAAVVQVEAAAAR